MPQQDDFPNTTDQQSTPDDAPEASTTEGAVGESEPEISDLASDLAKFKDLALRSQADFDNYRKRAAREREEAVRFANLNLIENLLPVLDNFELGLSAAANDPQGAVIVQGFAMVQRQFGDFLKSVGVEAVDVEPGTLFDAKLHEALGQEESASIPEGAVIRQIRRGYRLRDRLIRAAAVFVSKGSNPLTGDE